MSLPSYGRSQFTVHSESRDCFLCLHFMKWRFVESVCLQLNYRSKFIWLTFQVMLLVAIYKLNGFTTAESDRHQLALRVWLVRANMQPTKQYNVLPITSLSTENATSSNSTNTSLQTSYCSKLRSAFDSQHLYITHMWPMSWEGGWEVRVNKIDS